MGQFFELVLELRVANGGILFKLLGGLPTYQRHARTHARARAWPVACGLWPCGPDGPDGPGPWPWALGLGRRPAGDGRRANREATRSHCHRAGTAQSRAPRQCPTRAGTPPGTAQRARAQAPLSARATSACSFCLFTSFEVTGPISDWNGRRWPAPIGLKFCEGTFLGYRNVPSKSQAWRTRGLGDASETWGRRARFVGICPVLAPSEGTPPGHDRDAVVRF